MTGAPRPRATVATSTPTPCSPRSPYSQLPCSPGLAHPASLGTLPSLDGLVGAPSQRTVILLAGALALVVVLVERLWRPARTVVTIAHEAGHAGVAVASGRTLTQPASGCTPTPRG